MAAAAPGNSSAIRQSDDANESEQQLPKSSGEAKDAMAKAVEVAKQEKPADAAAVEFDDFGLPIRKAEAAIQYAPKVPEPIPEAETAPEPKPESEATSKPTKMSSPQRTNSSENKSSSSSNSSSSRPSSESKGRGPLTAAATVAATAKAGKDSARDDAGPLPETTPTEGVRSIAAVMAEGPPTPVSPKPATQAVDEAKAESQKPTSHFSAVHARVASTASSVGVPVVISEFSHQQQLVTKKGKQQQLNGGNDGDDEESDDGGWQTMPAFAPYDLYDDDNRLIAREHVEEESDTEKDGGGYAGLGSAGGGAGKGYTRVLVDEDAESATSMDDKTQYLFSTAGSTSILEDEEQQRDAVSQMRATKHLLTEGQRIAYVGITRLHLWAMLHDLEALQEGRKKNGRKELQRAAESLKMWAQKMMIRLYAHMDISVAEQIMIEQLNEHGVQAKDLTPALMTNARVKNPMAEEGDMTKENASVGGSPPGTRPVSMADPAAEPVAEPPPPYEKHQGEELPAVRMPSQLPDTDKIDIDLRWTALCDLFLVLIADSAYDARSRVLLERVGASLDIPAIDICKFERKVTEALEMQQNAERENWDEKDHMEARRKLALKRRYVMMGLATVGGGLVIGLSAGLLAPVIGAGLAAGFTTLGVTGTSGFLAGAGGAAIITSSAAASGSVIGGRAADRRTGAVKTFEYRPLHNNKRVNLIVTVSGWMTGKIDDVRLPYSTVDPVMGDIYSVLWEPEMLTSMGDTINILATEALTQGLQQLLGSTILVSLMAALQLPVVLTKLSYLIDNPWAVSLDRATMAGLILADSLLDRNLGTRPVTLVGYSLGSRVIFSCLQELARKGGFGLVQNVFLFGSPVVVKKDEYLRARAVVAGRFINGYNRNDWILGYLFRLTNGGIRRVAGLGPIEDVPAMENMDVTEFVVGHMDYRTAMPRLLRECGWLVESDEFTEIEDPDPENHAERQRELINEIEEARKELEKESKTKKSGKFGFFSRKKRTEKQEWELYEDSAAAAAAAAAATAAAAGAVAGAALSKPSKVEDAEGNNHGVLFDVDAIRAQLAQEKASDSYAANSGEILPLEQLQVRELKSTLPPMKLDLSPASSSTSLPTPARTTTRPSSLRSASAARAILPETAVGRPTSEYRTSSAQVWGEDITASYLPPLPKKRMSTPVGATTMTATTTTSTMSRGRTPSTAYATPAQDYSEGISMTFDSAFDDSGFLDTTAGHRTAGTSPLTPPKTPSATSRVQEEEEQRQPQQHETPSSPAPPPPPPKDLDYMANADSNPFGGSSSASGAIRATTTRAATVPAITLSDPWADDDDDDFGKEQEISMTFA